jgi:amino acid adenylation domain-containing protein/non-ribosomal peptide synthase protein (TIGR01720 family)
MSANSRQTDSEIEGFRLSPQQKRLWLLAQGDAEHCSQCVIRLEGSLQLDRLRRSLQSVVDAHEAFRTVFYHRPGMKMPIQVISDQCAIEWNEIDLRQIDLEEHEASLSGYVNSERTLSLGLEQSPSLRAMLVTQSPRLHRLVLTMNSLCADRWTLRNLFHEISRRYALNQQIDSDDVVQYKQFAEWQNELLENEEAEEAGEYWAKQRLASSSSASTLPWGHKSARDGGRDIDSISVKLDSVLVAGIDTLAKHFGATAEVVLLGCLQMLICKSWAQHRGVLDYLADGRSYAELHDAMGVFAKCVPISFELNDDLAFYEVLQRAVRSIEDARAWQDYFAVDGGTSSDEDALEQAAASIVFGFDELPTASIVDGVIFELNSQYVQMDCHNIHLSCVRADDRITAEFYFNLANVGAEAVEYIGRLFKSLLRSAIANPGLPIRALNCLSDADRRTVIVGFNPAASVYPQDVCIHGLFEHQVARVPDCIALTAENHQLTYAGLEARANQLAGFLIRRGAKPGARVALCLERSIETFVALLGILKAGAAYVPLEGDHPLERLAFQISAARCSLVITEDRFLDRFIGIATDLVNLDRLTIADELPVKPGLQLSSEQPCYVIYTSGSTGSPKGVAVSHRSLVNYTLSICKVLSMGEETREQLRFATVSTLSADLGNTTIFTSLISGGCLHIVGRDIAADGRLFAEYMAEHIPDVLKIVPAHLGALIEAHRGAPALPGRYLILGGEALSFDFVNRLARASDGCRVINHYGPTETTVGSLTCAWDEERRYDLVASSVPIGRPLANTRAYVLDTGLEPAPIGVPGELCIAGDGLALGYVQNPEQTAAKFIPDPFAINSGARLYRTGDLVRYLFDGNIEFLGRADHQVKVHGYRIELGEIESALTKHTGVRKAVVTVRDDESGHRRLIAYITSEDFVPPTNKELRGHLEQTLPDYMVPSVFVPLKALPLTPNGKVDRGALPGPDSSATCADKTYVAPRTRVEEVLAKVWGDVLGVARLGVHDNYFELGGDSILSLQIIARAREAGIRITPKQVFQHRTVAELSMVAGVPVISQPEQEEISTEVPLTPIQHWLFEHDSPQFNHWNFPVLLQTPEKLNPLVLEDAVKSIYERHDTLRYRFVKRDSQWHQYTGGLDWATPFSVVDLSAISHERIGRLIELLAPGIQARLDLSQGPLFRVTLFRTSDRELDRILVVTHHLVVDGVSLRILLEDLQMAYRQLVGGEVVELPQKTTSFRRWSSRLGEEAESETVRQELTYWLSRIPGDIELQADYPEGLNTVASARTVFVSLSAEDTEALLRRAPRAYNTQINDILVGALAQTLGDWTGRRSIALTLEGHGRAEISEEIDVSRTVGWFTTQYPVVLDVSGSSDAGEFLKAVKEDLRLVPNRGIGYGLLRYLTKDEEISGRLRAARQPQVKFNYLGQFDHVLSTDALFGLASENCGSARSPLGHRTELLEIIAEVAGDQLTASWSYSANVHSRATIEHLAQKFLQNVKALVSHCISPGIGGYTPSDFPLARMSQRDLDRLTSGLSQQAEPTFAGGDIEDIFRLTPMQEGMLFHSLMTPEKDAYFIQVSFTLRGTLDASAFTHAWQRVTDRHPALRSAFVWEETRRPVQVIHRRIKLLLEQEDWSDLPRPSQEGRLAALLRADQERGFTLFRPPLMRLKLIRLADQEHRFIWSFHHLLLDGWSKSIVLLESLALYEARCRNDEPLLGPPAPVRGYLEWLERQDIRNAKAYWQSLLEGFTARTPLGGGVLEEAVLNGDVGYGEQRTQLSAEATTALQSMARRHDLTLNAIIQGCWAMLLSWYSGEQDVVFGVTVSGRPPELPNVESMVGVFINTLPLRVRVEPSALIIPWLKSLQAQQLEMSQHEYSPLVQVQQWSDLGPGQSLFDSTVAFENYPVRPELTNPGRMLEVDEIRVIEKNNYPVTLMVTPATELSLWLVFDERRIRCAMMARMLVHLVALLESFPEGQGRQLSTFLPLSDIERHQVLVEWNDTEHVSGGEAMVHELFGAQARISPDAIAAVFEDSHLSYEELAGRSDRLAQQLRSMGVEPESPVAVVVERSLTTAVAVLGVLKSGGVYLPLDPAYPRDRIGYMLEDARAAVLIAPESLAKGLADHKAALLDPDSGGGPFAGSGVARKCREAVAENLCYVMYTSGSTGRPKGVALSHSSLVNLIRWQMGKCQTPKSARVLQFAPSSFDVSFQEMFSTWCSGGTLILISEERRRDVSLLWQFVTHEAIERLFLPVVALQHIADVGQRDGLGACVREIITSGAQLRITPQVMEMFARLEGLLLQNQYGPSESHAVTAITLSGSALQWPALPPIGRVVDNAQVYVLDRHQNPVCAGVLGEVNIGGECLARGYLGRPDLTAEKFMPDPFGEEPGSRLYKSGDVARYGFDGVIEFAGRTDDQVKIRGFRVEPAEIEAVLSQHPDVRQAAVVIHDDDRSGKRLVSFVVSDQNEPPTASDLREFLSHSLPEFMVPSAIVFIDAMPLTSNGKLDRRKLAQFDQPESSPGEKYIAPVTEAEQTVARIWNEFLGFKQIGIDDNFFELGGDSLLAMQVVNTLRQVFQTEFPLRNLFEGPTVRATVDMIASAWGDIETVEEIARTYNNIGELTSAEVRGLLFDENAESQEG